jgi:hypothetical protein
MKKLKSDRRCGVERREFHYSACTPERRNGKDRRIAKNGKEVSFIKLANELHKGGQQYLVHGK